MGSEEAAKGKAVNSIWDKAYKSWNLIFRRLLNDREVEDCLKLLSKLIGVCSSIAALRGDNPPIYYWCNLCKRDNKLVDCLLLRCIYFNIWWRLDTFGINTALSSSTCSCLDLLICCRNLNWKAIVLWLNAVRAVFLVVSVGEVGRFSKVY